MAIFTLEDLIYIPILALILMMWFFASKLFKNINVADSVTNSSSEKNFKKLEKIHLNTRIDDNEAELQLNTKVGRKIVKIYYININHDKYEYDRIDSVDFGVILQFDNNEFINWIWKEGEQDLEKGISIHTGYYLDFSNIIHTLQLEDVAIEVSNSEKWSSFVNSEIVNIKLIRKEADGNKVCQKMIIKTKPNNIVGIFSTEEPTILNDNQLEVNLEFDVDWTTIIFDETLISSLKFN
jgi:hypothetical protein